MDEQQPKSCYWCGGDTESNLSGHYVEGWIAYVGCKNSFCCARGPNVKTKGMSCDKHITRNEAVKQWNMIGSPLAAAVIKRRSTAKKRDKKNEQTTYKTNLSNNRVP